MSKLLLLLLALTACVDQAPPGTAIVRDSSGIRIVENITPLWQEGQEWHLSPEPVVDIGAAEGDPSQQLYQVANAVRLDDGRIAIANSGTRELRLYDATGSHVRSTGREGDGPGEFRGIGWFQRWPHDSLATFDFFQRRVSIFDDQVVFARAFRLEGVNGVFPQPVGVFDDGRLLARAVVGQPEEGRHWVPAALYLYDVTGTLLDSVGADRGTEMLFTQVGGSRSILPPPFGRSSTVVTRGDLFFVGVTDTYEVKAFNPDGTPVSITRLLVTPHEVSGNDLDAELERQLGFFGDSGLRSAIERRLRELPLPETFPAFGPAIASRWPSNHPLIADLDNNFWVMEYDRPGSSDVRWSVFDSAGTLLGTVDFPKGFVLLEAGPDYVLGHWKDELDVEHVQLYDLIKPGQ